MFRGILAVLAGIAALTLISFAIEAAANPLLIRIFPNALPDQASISQNINANLFLYAYTALSIAAGGYVTAWLAPRWQVRLAVIMGAVEVALIVLAMMAFLHTAPLRNWVVSIVLSVPAAWCGGMLRARRE
jgi:peptidoglycan/LPS O-acetylase OafA/YrhL